MSLYTKKKDVERYVCELLSKAKTADERKLKGFSIARMYHQVGEHMKARKYLYEYLEARPSAAPAHKLLGQVLAAEGDREAALAEYARALELDPHQKDLVKEGCKLLLDLPVTAASDARWLELAAKYLPNDPVVYQLKERRLQAPPGGAPDLEQLDQLMAEGLEARPTDPERHVRLVERLVAAGSVAEAFRYVRQVEERRPFPEASSWYTCVADTCQRYQEQTPPALEAQLLQLTALDRLVTLGLELREPTVKIVTNLYKLDQLLFEASRGVAASSEPEQTRQEARVLLSHLTGQLYYHMGSVLLYSATQGGGGGGDSREAADMALALFLASQAFPPLEPVSSLYQLSKRQATLDGWRQQAGARQVEVGWAVIAAERNKHLQLVQQQFCNQKGRGRIHGRVFRSSAVSPLGRRDTSAFLALPAFLETNPVPARAADLQTLAPLFWAERGGSLQHAAWLRARSGQTPSPALGAHLQLAAPAGGPAAPETLARIDLLAFLEATVFTTSRLRSASARRSAEDIYPPAVASRLCTEEQAEWWSAVHRLQSSCAPARDLASLRRTLQRGLETIRCLSGHGNSVRLVVHLAKWALEQAVSCPPTETEPFESRAELYLRCAVQQLNSLVSSGQPTATPKHRLFDTVEPEPGADEAGAMLEETQLLLSELLVRRQRPEEALQLVRGLAGADAAYQQGLILRQLAERPGADGDASDLLRQALESFYLTLDRLRDPLSGSSASRQLKDELAVQIEEVENLMAQEAASSTHVNGTSSVQADLERSLGRRTAGLGVATSTPRRPVTITPRRPATATVGTSPLAHNLSSSFNQESRPSLERLCAQVLSLASSQDAIVKLLSERNDRDQDQIQKRLDDIKQSVLTEVRSLVTDEVKQIKQMLQEFKVELDELKSDHQQQQQQQQADPLAAAAAAAAQPPPMVPPDLAIHGYMAAIMQMQRGLPMMPLPGMPGMPPLPGMVYPPAAYQGLPLQDPLQDSLGSQSALQAQLAAQAALATPQAALGTPQVPMGLSQPAMGTPQPTMGTPQPTMGTPQSAMGTPQATASSSQPSALKAALAGPSVTSTPSAPPSQPNFSFKPSALSEGGATSTPVKPAAPANVTVSSREPLPARDDPAAAAATPPSVIVPPQHIKPQVPTPQTPASGQSMFGQKSPHNFQIKLPNNAQLNVTSPLGDSDKPAFSSVSSLPNIAAPEFSAVTPLPGTRLTPGRSPGRERLDSTGSFHEDPEYEAMADFKPIVPLPEEVEVRTGEEGDAVLFAGRCKLYRFTEKEWKERGVGEIRILHRIGDGKVRVIMRRDQTHKVCANHFVQPGMELMEMKNQPRALTWAAKDFADEELVEEKLCARFKTDEIMEEFRAAFEKGLQIVSSVSPGKGSTKGSPSVRLAPAHFSFTPSTSTAPAFTSKPGEAGSAAVSKPSTIASAAGSKPAAAGSFTFGTAASSAATGFSFGTPSGAAIPTVVSARGEQPDEDEDEEYETEEETTTSENEDESEDERVACKPEFNFGSSAAPGESFSFGFGGAAAAAAGAETKPATAASGGFKFGDKAPAAAAAPATFGFPQGQSTAPAASATGGSSSGFVFGQPAPASTAGISSFSIGKTTVTPVPATSGESATPSAAATSSGGGFKFGQGLASLSFGTPTASAASEPKTSLGGFSFTTTPTVKKPDPPAATAAATSAEQSKPSPFAGFSFGAGAGMASFASAAQSGPGFKTDDSFKGFAGTGTPLFGTPVKPAGESGADQEGEADTSATDEYEPNVHFEPVVPLPELVEKRTGEESEEKLFGHRAKLYRMDRETKEWKERGLGEMKIMRNTETGKCRVLMRREQVLKLCANHVITPEMRLGPLSSSETAWVWSANDFSEGEANVEMLAVKFKTVEQAKEFKRVFESCQTAKPITKPAETTAKTPEASKPAVTSSQSATTPTSVAATTTTATSASTPSRPSFVFGAGAAAAGGGQFSFSGVKPKSPVKPRSRDVSLNESAAGDDNEYYEGDEGEHLLFEPVIPLPDKVEVRTGEEDDEVLYSHRSKLYRFDKDGGEWKERGLGDIKLLKNRNTAAVRLLMRREQVLKICLNHRVTPQLKLSMKDPKSVTWAALDYAEPEPRDEVFTARFKTPEVAAQFVDAVKKAQENLSDSPSKPAAGSAQPSSPKPAPSAPAPASTSTPKQPVSAGQPAAQSPGIFGGGGAATSPGSGFSFGARFGGGTAPAAAEAASASFTFTLPSTAEPAAGAQASDDDSDDVVIVGELQATPEQRAAAERLQLPAGFYLYEQRPPCRGCRGCRDEMPGEQSAGDAGGSVSQQSVSTSASSSATSTSSTTSTTSTPATPSTSATSSTSVLSGSKFSFAFGGGQSTAAQSTPKATFSFATSTTPGGAEAKTGSVFGQAGSTPGASIFGGQTEEKAKSIFGGSAGESGSIFGSTGSPAQSVFGGSSTKPGASVFGGTGVEAKPGSIFGGATTEAKPWSIFGGTGSSETKPSNIFGGIGTGKSVFGGSGQTGSVFSGSGQTGSVFGGAAADKTPAVGAQSGAATNGLAPSAPPAEADKSENQAPFGFALQSSGPTLDFAALAKKEGTFASNADPNFKFSGAGAALFSSSAAASAGEAESGADESRDDSTHDPHFEPVVPLPELVDVRTGEEDEQQKFCHRAILYRFNNDTSEWKERGRGDFKLLHNTATGAYRLLLRRDQVHKLACNHRITPSMSLSPLGSSANAWVWSAVDYADEEPKPETLAVKFKTETLAQEFRAEFEAAQRALRAAESAAPAPAPAGAAGAERNAQDEESASREEEEEDYEEDSPMFEKRATLSARDGDGWQTLGTGYLRVLYDDDIFGAKVVMVKDGSEDVLCDMLITTQHKYQVEGKTVTWTALDYAPERPERRTLRAVFASAAAAADLGRVMDEGVEIAAGSGLQEEVYGEEEHEPPASGEAAESALGACDPRLAAALAELLSETVLPPVGAVRQPPDEN